MAKPDDRSDNVNSLQEAMQNTLEKVEESKDYIAAHADEMNPEEKQQLEEKNENREESIDGFRNEIQDEAQHQKQE